jgi:hypothetical protein
VHSFFILQLALRNFIRIHRGHPVVSTAMVEPITRRLVAPIEDYVRDRHIAGELFCPPFSILIATGG